jgi:hypothetical protein
VGNAHANVRHVTVDTTAITSIVDVGVKMANNKHPVLVLFAPNRKQLRIPLAVDHTLSNEEAADAAERVGLPRSTRYRIVTLDKNKYMDFVRGSTYEIPC